MQIITYQLRFQMWLYSVGHSRLLLRSPKSDISEKQVDILFKNVAYVNLPVILEGVSILELQNLHLDWLDVSQLRFSGKKIYQVSGSSYNGFVVAGAVTWAEDSGDYDAPSSLM